MFRVEYRGPTGWRYGDVEANNHAHALAMAEQGVGEGETVARARLASSYGGEPDPRMPSDHARNVATGSPRR